MYYISSINTYIETSNIKNNFSSIDVNLIENPYNLSNLTSLKLLSKIENIVTTIATQLNLTKKDY